MSPQAKMTGSVPNFRPTDRASSRREAGRSGAASSVLGIGFDASSSAAAARSAAGPRKNSDSACIGSWNFGAASLYNAAMLPNPRACRSALRGLVDALGGRRPRGLALALLGSLALASTAQAQAPTPAREATAKPDKPAAKSGGKSGGKPAATSASKPATNKAGNKVISLDDEFLVEGKLEKPSAFYVLRRSATDYDWARLDAVFTPLVLESVQDPLF